MNNVVVIKQRANIVRPYDDCIAMPADAGRDSSRQYGIRFALLSYNFIVLIICLSSLIWMACGVYSLSGSTLPGHIKTVEIPVFANSTLEPGIDDEITAELSNEILKSQLRPANRDADAVISGAVTRYTHRPHTFGAGGAEVSVELYIVQVSADVEFYDNVKGQSIYKGTVSGDGPYDFQNEDEQTGRAKAVKNLVEKIIQNSVQMW